MLFAIHGGEISTWPIEYLEDWPNDIDYIDLAIKAGYDEDSLIEMFGDEYQRSSDLVYVNIPKMNSFSYSSPIEDVPF